MKWLNLIYEQKVTMVVWIRAGDGIRDLRLSDPSCPTLDYNMKETVHGITGKWGSLFSDFVFQMQLIPAGSEWSRTIVG